MRGAVTPSGRDLALFDFDGTLTDRDSFLDFVRHITPAPQLLVGLLRCLPAVIAWKLGLLSRQRGKEAVMRVFFGGMREADFNRLCLDYATQRIPQLLRPGARAALERHRRRGDRIVVVSASPENWIAPWCAAEGIELLATALRVVDGRISGQIDGRNCHGAEKVRRIRAHLRTGDYARIHAYGDSSGDREMLAMADEAHYRPFRERSGAAAPEA